MCDTRTCAAVAHVRVGLSVVAGVGFVHSLLSFSHTFSPSLKACSIALTHSLASSFVSKPLILKVVCIASFGGTTIERSHIVDFP